MPIIDLCAYPGRYKFLYRYQFWRNIELFCLFPSRKFTAPAVNASGHSLNIALSLSFSHSSISPPPLLCWLTRTTTISGLKLFMPYWGLGGKSNRTFFQLARYRKFWLHFRNSIIFQNNNILDLNFYSEGSRNFSRFTFWAFAEFTPKLNLQTMNLIFLNYEVVKLIGGIESSCFF